MELSTKLQSLINRIVELEAKESIGQATDEESYMLDDLWEMVERLEEILM